jgi:phytol kinase
MDSSFIRIAIPFVLLLLGMGILSRIDISGVVGRELKRKALHISVGLIALSFPLFLTTPSMIIAALGLVMVWLLAVRHNSGLQRRFGTVLHDIRPESLGEIYFAISIAGLLLLTQNEPLFFVIPMLTLALADAFAAIVGKVFPVGPLAGIARGKTTAGCATFFVVAFIVSFWSLEYFAELQIAHALLVATGLALTTCCVEAISRRGIDNLIVPAVAYLTLHFSNIPDGAGNTTVAQLQLDLNALVAGL